MEKVLWLTEHVKKSFVKFWVGDFSLDDAPLLGRPVEADSDPTKTLIENNQYSTMWEKLTHSKYTSQ